MKIVSILIFFLMFLSSIVIFVPGNASGQWAFELSYPIGFEDGTIGEDYDKNFGSLEINTVEMIADNFQVDNRGDPRTGTKEFFAFNFDANHEMRYEYNQTAYVMKEYTGFYYIWTDVIDWSPWTTEYNYLYFEAENNTNIIEMRFHWKTSPNYGVQYNDGSSWIWLGNETWDSSTKEMVGWEYIDEDTVRYWFDGNYKDDNDLVAYPNPRVYNMQTDRAGDHMNLGMVMDDLNIVLAPPYGTGGIPPETKNLYLKVFDGFTGNQLHCFGSDTNLFYVYQDDPSLRGTFESDLWTGDYDISADYGTTVSFTELDFTNGDYHWINITDMVAIIDGETVYYPDYSSYRPIYAEQTIYIYLGEIDFYDGFFNCIDSNIPAKPPYPQLYATLCTDKQYYTYGETVLFKYSMPTAIEMDEQGYPASDYFIWIIKHSKLVQYFFEFTFGGTIAENWPYIDLWKCSQDNEEHIIPWASSGATPYPDPGGLDRWRFMIGHGGGGVIGADTVITDKGSFWISSGLFTPQGNISSVSPDPPQLGQTINITFEVNNDGLLTIRNILAPETQEKAITSFQKFSGLDSVNYQIHEFGRHIITLYVSDGFNDTEVDTYTVDITDINGTFGQYGYGVEFLTTEPYYPIAGFDTVFINYKTLDDDTKITIVDPRGQRVPGFLVNTGFGVLNYTLPPYAEIGEWKVTMYANETLNSTFNVIATENNYIEFSKNVFYDTESFNVKLKHDKKVEIVFYKDEVQTGQDLFIEKSLMQQGYYDIPLTNAHPTAGNWRVELWEVNNLIKVRKLAQDTCIVVTAPAATATEPGYDNIFQMLTLGATQIAGGGLGLAFMAILLIMVVIVILSMLKMKNDTIFLVSIAMMLFTTYIGWLPVWIAVISIILAGLVFSSVFQKKLKIG